MEQRIWARSLLMLAVGLAVGPVSIGRADVRLLSRESEIRDRKTSLFFPDQVRHDEFASFSGAGDWDITLPHRFRHTGFASDTLIGGTLNGDYRSSVNGDSIRRRSTAMMARFEVAGEPASAMLEYRGQISPSGLGAADGNIVLSLTHLESGTEVFNIYRDGSPILWPQNVIEWRPATWSQTLAIGTYEFRLRAFPWYTDFYGGGISTGSGSVTATLTLVPTPSTAWVALASLSLAARRRSIIEAGPEREGAGSSR
ncbi:MAG: hypothetical protein HEQ23_12590 [Tepidisphaera sp.]